MLTSFSVAWEFFISIVHNFVAFLRSIVLTEGVSIYSLLVAVLLFSGLIALLVRRSGG